MESIIREIKKGKAPGWDLIDPEHVLYGGDALFHLLTVPFNQVTEHKSLLSHLKKGVMVPVPKGNGNSRLKDNNRGITIGCTFAKLYEKLLVR